MGGGCRPHLISAITSSALSPRVIWKVGFREISFFCRQQAGQGGGGGGCCTTGRQAQAAPHGPRKARHSSGGPASDGVGGLWRQVRWAAHHGGALVYLQAAHGAPRGIHQRPLLPHAEELVVDPGGGGGGHRNTAGQSGWVGEGAPGQAGGRCGQVGGWAGGRARCSLVLHLARPSTGKAWQEAGSHR